MSDSLEMEKCEQATEILKELNIDLWLVWVRETSQMADPVLDLILGGDLVWQSALMFTQTGEKIALVGSFDVDGLLTRGIFDRVLPYTKTIKDDLIAVLEDKKPRKIAVNFSKNDVAADGLTVGMYRILQDYLESTTYQDSLVSAEDIITRLRGRKTPTEIERITRAVEITENIYETAKAFVKIGMTELEIYDFFHQQMDKHGVGNAWNADHNPAVDAGPDKSFGHSGPTENKTKEGHLLHFDFGVKHEGYCSDIQRMFYFGSIKDVPEEISSAFRAVRDAITKASKFIKPGKKGHEVDSIARDFVKERGYEEYQHALGHQVGRHAHDGGVLLGPLWERYGNSPKGAVEKGNVFTLELYVTTENYGQVSLEEDIVVTNDGCRFLSNPQRELICIEK